MPNGSPRVLLVCAISPEWDALSSRISNRQAVRPDASVYELGNMEVDGRTLEVYLCRVGPGSLDAALGTHNAVTLFDPHVVLFVGVAGGIKDCAIGDVVAATKNTDTSQARKPTIGTFRDPLWDKVLSDQTRSLSGLLWTRGTGDVVSGFS